MKYSASIVVFNSELSQIGQLVALVLKHEKLESLYLIDNSSNFPFDTMLVKYSFIDRSKIVFLNSHGNIGYGAGHNIAIKNTTSEIHFVLNPDITFEVGALDELANEMNNGINVGQIMPRVVYPTGELQPLCKLLPRPVDLIGRRFLSFLYNSSKSSKRYMLEQYRYEKLIFVPNLSGCFMCLNIPLTRQIGGFDERFFMYLEDVDLTRRLAVMADTICVPNVTVVHEYAKKSYHSVSSMILHTKSAIKYFNKWGWFFDKGRSELNRRCLNQFKPFLDR